MELYEKRELSYGKERKMKRIKKAIALLTLLVMVFNFSAVIRAEGTTVAFSATSDANGKIIETMIKGDVNGDGKIDTADLTQIRAIVAGEAATPAAGSVAFENADINGNGIINADDTSILRSLLEAGTFDASLTFRAVDEPAAGYKVKSVTITAGNNAAVVLTPAAPTSGSYKLVIGTADDDATVTGPVSATVTVQFVHELYPAAIALSYGSDANGAVTEWMLKGDTDRDKDLDGADVVAAVNHDLSTVVITDALALESGDIDNDSSVDTGDYRVMNNVLRGVTTLPAESFSFRVVDTPKTGYKVKSATIKAGSNAAVVLTPAAPTSGTYKLVIAADGKATVTGTSLAINDVQFVHEKIKVQVRVGVYITNDNNQFPAFSGTYYPFINYAGYAQVDYGDTASLSATDIATILGYDYITNSKYAAYTVDTANSLLTNSAQGTPADAFPDDTTLNQFVVNSEYAPTGATYNTFVYLRIVLKAPTNPTGGSGTEIDKDIPMDLLVDNGDGTTYINGPRDAKVGGTVKYSSTIDMSEIAAIAANFGNSIGYITGSFTITLTGSKGITPAAGFGTSADINDYFAGGAIELFELTAAPTYDSATNKITFNVKVKDEYNQAATALTGTECAAILNKGISGNSNYTAVVNSDIVTPGYSRAVATFSGTLNYHNAANTLNFTINMTGVQDDPDNLKDPTLGKLGSDAETVVSTTVTYKATHPNTGDSTNIGIYTVAMAAAVIGMAWIVIETKRKGCRFSIKK